MNKIACFLQRFPGLFCKSTGQVGVAAMMVLAAITEKIVRVWVAAGSNHVMYRAAEFIEAVPVECVVRDRCDRAQVRHIREELIAKANMRSIERARLAGIKPLTKVLCIKQVQIADLRTFAAKNTAEMSY